ncbi:2OG-Fe dioxygenase family protein [Lentzea sp. NPDC059081]|uniref:2OG-Fe dioxygenase family protein n=1 Tax=Lentzea sp. NPDC059081 TaxID=3346719 RepID=UPI0036AA1BB4
MTQPNTAVREKLSAEGFVVTNDRELGMVEVFREKFHQTYFTDEHLRSYEGDIPADRLRARDVLRYDRIGGEIAIKGHHDIGIEGRGEHAGRREFVRTDLAADEHFVDWVKAILSVVPEQDQQVRGTFGVNLFRTRSKVVTRPHRDGEQYIIVYVVDKNCDGGETMLHDGTGDVLFRGTLVPGDLIIFRDEDFLHSVTELEAINGECRRDALVCTVNYSDTYPLGDN